MADSKADLRAFALRADVGELSGATTSYDDGLTFDIAAALQEGDGTITVDAVKQPGLAEVLAATQILKSVPAAEGDKSKGASAQKAS